MIWGNMPIKGRLKFRDGLNQEDEMAIREKRLAQLAEAKKVLAERANERYLSEQAEYEAKLKKRTEKARKRHGKPRGQAPQAPQPGPQRQRSVQFHRS